MSNNQADQLADWIINNQDKKGTPNFNTVAEALKELNTTQQPTTPKTTSNPFSGFKKRGLELVQGVLKAPSYIEKVVGEKTGFGAIDITGSDPEGNQFIVGYDRLKELNKDDPLVKGINASTDFLQKKIDKIDYQPTVAWDELKENPSVGNIVAFTGERSITMLPDTIGALANLPAYITSRIPEIAEERARNDGREEVNPNDVLLAIPTSVLIGNLERIGGKAIFGKSAGGAGSRVVKGGSKEAITEGVQTPVEYSTTTVGTKQGFQPLEAIDQTAEGFVSGGLVGGTQRGAVETAGGIAKGVKNITPDLSGYQAEDDQAGAELAQRLQKIADDNNFDLQDIGKMSWKGARETADQAHVDLDLEMKQLLNELRNLTGIDKDGIDTIEKVIKKIGIKKAYRKARNKTKNVVGVQDLKDVEDLTGHTVEGQRLLSLMRQSNELTKLHNSGYQGGLSKYTDLLTPFGGGMGYDRGQANLERVLRPALTGGLAMQTGGATLLGQAGLAGAGRVIDKVTGQRSVLDQYVKANTGQQGIPITSNYSLRQERIDEEDRANRERIAQQIQQNIQDQQNAQNEALTQEQLAQTNLDLVRSGATPTKGSPEAIIQEATGLDRRGIADILNILERTSTDPIIKQAILDYRKNIAFGNTTKGIKEILNMNQLIRAINAVADNNPELANKRIAVPDRGGVQASQANQQPQPNIQQGQQTDQPKSMEQLRREAGIEKNMSAIKSIVDMVTNDPEMSTVDKSVLLDGLDKLTDNLGKYPLDRAEVIRNEALIKLDNKNKISFIDGYIDRIRIQQANPEDIQGMANIENQGINREVSDEVRNLSILNRLDSDGNFIIQDNVATKTNAEGNIEAKQIVKLPDALKLLQDERGNVNLSEQTPENRKLLSDIMTAEALAGLNANKDALGWYDRTLTVAKDVLSLVHPEIATDVNADHAITFATAITSNGAGVIDNWESANEQYEHWKKTGGLEGEGRFLVKGYGKQIEAMEQAFELYNDLRDYGLSDARVKELLNTETTAGNLLNIPIKETSNYTLGDLFAEKGMKLSGQEAVNTPVNVSYIFGAKIGQGFYQNLSGNYEPLTADRWFSRLFNRIQGTPFSVPQQKTIDNNLSKLKNTLFTNKSKWHPDERKIINKALKDFNITKKSSKEDLFQAIMQINKDYDNYYKKKVSPLKKEDRPTKSQVVNDIQSFVRLNTDQEQIDPRNANERLWMRQIVSDTLQNLENQGIKLTTADLQALLWFQEKRLMKSMGVRSGRGDDNDYLDASIELVKKKGITNEQISKSLPSDYRDRLTPFKSEQKTTQDIRSELSEGILEQTDIQGIEQPSPQPILRQEKQPTSSNRRLLDLLDNTSKGKFPWNKFNKDLIAGVDQDGRQFITRVAVGLDGKGLSEEDAVALLPLLRLTFAYFEDVQGMNKEFDDYVDKMGGAYVPLENGASAVMLRRNADFEKQYDQTAKDVFLHEIGHHFGNKAGLDAYLSEVKEMISAKNRTKEFYEKNTNQQILRKQQEFDQLLRSSMAFREGDWANLYNTMQDLEGFIKSRLGVSYPFKAIENIEKVLPVLGESRLMIAPSDNIKAQIVNDLNQALFETGSQNLKQMQDIGLTPEFVSNNLYQFWNKVEYQQSPKELGADAMAMYLRDPKTFKKKYPQLSKRLRSLVNTSNFKDYIILNSIAGLMTSGTLMALLSASEDDERGVLNFGSGRLSI